MGYTTEFTGELRFTHELTASQLAYIQQFLGEDVRDHKDWGTPEELGLQYTVDLRLTNDFSGIEWDGSEKAYHMVNQVNFVIGKMKDKYPDFGLVGRLSARGEDCDDVWELVIENGVAVQHELTPTGTKVTCPHCEGTFYWEGP